MAETQTFLATAKQARSFKKANNNVRAVPELGFGGSSDSFSCLFHVGSFLIQVLAIGNMTILRSHSLDPPENKFKKVTAPQL